MTDAFRIEVEQWLRGAAGAEHERQTLAAVRIQVGDLCLTRVEDLEAKTVRDSAHLSAYRLAYWLAEHWWRLRWEPELAGEAPDWLMSHSLGAAGDGFIWPPLTLASDGEAVHLSMRASPDRHGVSPIRYLDTLDAVIRATDFERGVDRFIAAVLARLANLGLRGTDLELLWAEVAEERRTPDLEQARRLEALLGIDAGEAEAGLLKQVGRFAGSLGTGAVAEIAAAARDGFLEAAKLAEAGRDRAKTKVELAERDVLNGVFVLLRADAPPAWQLGEALADRARALWHVGSGPLTNRQLAEIGGLPMGFLTDDQAQDLGDCMDGIGYREPRDGKGFRAQLRSPYPTNRRFQLARLLADDILVGDDESVLPVTRAKTARQKLQRAFAAELLCPFEELREMLPASPDDDDLEDAARHFDVSPLLVRTTLVNKGVLPRGRLAAVG
ncbi:hypothetical protein [uncultured Thiohalocapsa sp.]|uniref:ImmA/IrrE family metallo-endopeptidase n=1 Tax=uncultured Thiohalocapsa sp. TaxID=768990 RepID=UPI0025DF3225|nr:hypothetical protein [uncultured Thiohalocapsa sp.]